MALKVVLLKNVDQVGQAGDEINVAPGYARNFLFPKHLAVQSTPGSQRAGTFMQSRHQQRKQKAWQQVFAALQAAPEKVVRVERKATPEGKLFGSVDTQALLEALAKLGFTVPKEHIVVPAAFKSVGDYSMQITGPDQQTVAWQVVISAEKETQPTA